MAFEFINKLIDELIS